MHHTRLPEEYLAQARARRGERAAISPENTALVVIDMQNVFVAQDAPMEVPTARGITPNINRLAEAFRHVGGKVIWVYTTLAEKGSDRDWVYLTDFVRAERREAIRAALRPGHEMHELWAELDVRPTDLLCAKDRFSPFSAGASDLDAMLKQAGISQLVIAGTLTNVCCECTARDAMMLNYHVSVVEDACAARTDEDHLRGLMTVGQLFAEIVTTDAMAEALA